MRVPNSPLHGDITVVRRATDADAELLARWHADPEIARYWDHETFSREEMVRRLTDRDVDAYVVEADDKPVGYLQAWFDGADSGGLDMFLIPAARGHGFGPDAARTLARHLLTTGQKRLSVDPYLSNVFAIRAWTKAGFQAVEEREPDSEHTEGWLLMVFDSTEAPKG
jgi:aminoglycoside 6'-N-acetyltransferase